MAIQAPIRKEINEYQSKLFFGLSGRQLLFSLAGVALGIGSYFLFRKLIGSELAGYVVIALTSPLFALGFIRIDNEPFEKYIIKLYRYTLFPKARVYKTYIEHHPQHSKQFLINKEQRDVKQGKTKSQSHIFTETLIKEYDYTARQRENQKTYICTK